MSESLPAPPEPLIMKTCFCASIFYVTIVAVENATLQKHLDNNCVAASYIVEDSNAEVLFKTASWFAKHFNPADVFWLTAKDGVNSIQVAETKDFIAKAYLAPVGARKLFIIIDASTMTVAAQNKLLKTIEDVPACTTFLLMATTVEPILNTVRSRCVMLYAPHAIRPLDSKYLNLPIQERYAMMTTQAIINKRVAANCNPQNQKDLLEILVYEKNSKHQNR